MNRKAMKIYGNQPPNLPPKDGKKQSLKEDLPNQIGKNEDYTVTISNPVYKIEIMKIAKERSQKNGKSITENYQMLEKLNQKEKDLELPNITIEARARRKKEIDKIKALLSRPTKY